MAQAIVSAVAGRLGDLLIQQAIFLVGVKDQVEDLRDELMWIQSFLEDADSRQDEGSVVRTWVSKSRDLAYDIEDIIDTYILKVTDQDKNRTPRRRRFQDSLKRYACICQKGANLYTIGKKVEEVKTRIQKIGDEMNRYGINRKDGGSRRGDRRSLSLQDRFQQLRRSSPHDESTLKDIFGLDRKADELVAELVHKQDQCRPICIAGMGGIGKTTLATKIYNHEEVKHHYKCRAWAYVSKDFSVKDVFKRLIKEVKPNLSAEELQEMGMFSEVHLEEKLRELLKDCTYLIVLDDIWDLEAWESLNRAFPQQSKNKGRVILTSRNTKVAKESIIHQLETLNETDSWKLFVVKVFNNDDCPTNLEESGKGMVKKCDGLPLAITVLAGLLGGKSPQEWFTVKDRIHQQLMVKEGQGKNNLEKILSLSYNDLPYELKACFLYIGLFPEDYEIIAEELIRLWVAEGFIRCESDETILEDVAREYLNELIDRNMLQVAYQDDLGKVCSCRIHDLLREFCISEGGEENFLDYYPRASSSTSSLTVTSSIWKSRRYAIHSRIRRYDFSNLSKSHLRTLLLFNPDKESLQQEQLESISNIRLLRVLDLSNVDLQGMMLPDSLGKLIHLRYFRLSDTKAKLPSSIECLRSLQNLDLWGSKCHWSDIAIDALSKLTQLRHLLLDYKYWDGLDTEVVALPRIDSLTNLQTLRWMDALVWKQNEKTKLINLRDLMIINIKTSDVESVLSSIVKLDKIQSLDLKLSAYQSTEYAFPMLVPLSHCHHLRALTLRGKIETLPADPYYEFQPRLTELNLVYSRLGPDTMSTLEKLPNLMSLYLHKSSYIGKKIVCSVHGFPQLRIFRTHHLETEEWEIEEGALPKLNRLCIENCYNLKKIPTGLSFVASLQVLEFYDMSEEFWDRFDRGEDAHEIGNIPSINTRR
ncbi:putative disease resistance RPP13-like protein 3 [Telopea speciosissima]|uniref:putative disease resistance RPP13-like protein 3 n=1 Tax=Telopea speciosissima TaxID=54955 RepID=UPI001CC4FCEB|nr:putative disease resistance RPP13-like protein 3 [Telopea speciosissima]